MTNREALKILKLFQEWRLGNDEIDMLNPATITEALDIAIKIMETKHNKSVMDAMGDSMNLMKLGRTHKIKNDEANKP